MSFAQDTNEDLRAVRYSSQQESQASPVPVQYPPPQLLRAALACYVPGFHLCMYIMEGKINYHGQFTKGLTKQQGPQPV